MPEKKSNYELKRNNKKKWYEIPEKEPIRFELVEVQDEFGTIQNAWWDGYIWDYGFKRFKGKILKWRNLFYQHRITKAGIEPEKDFKYGRIPKRERY